ncbi:MAG: hypothetical protein MK297_09430 [Planctomycetes bacterium]|nr:hypothetical protein [Planctomycetota bacterium]
MRYKLGKALQALGLMVVFMGLSLSIGSVQLSSALDSMWIEIYGLLGGMALFGIGYLILGSKGSSAG